MVGMIEKIKPYVYNLKYRLIMYTMVWSIGLYLLHLSFNSYSWLGFDTMINALGLTMVGAVLLSIVLLFVPVLVIGEMITGVYIKINLYKLKNRLIVYTIAGLSSSFFFLLLNTYEYIFKTDLGSVIYWFHRSLIMWFLLIFVPVSIMGEVILFMVKDCTGINKKT
jgi:hypothetical protein